MKAPHIPDLGTAVGVRDCVTTSAYLERVKAGEVFTVTDTGTRSRGLCARSRLARLLELAAQGRVTMPTGPRFSLGGHPACPIRR